MVKLFPAVFARIALLSQCRCFRNCREISLRSGRRRAKRPRSGHHQSRRQLLRVLHRARNTCPAIDRFVHVAQFRACLQRTAQVGRRRIPRGRAPWAPDISFFNGTYHLYYAVSRFGQNRSAIGLATSKSLDPQSPDYGWNDQGMVIETHQGDNWNAIDPNLVLDENGDPWLAAGSFWTGIKMRRLDRETGKVSESDPNCIRWRRDNNRRAPSKRRSSFGTAGFIICSCRSTLAAAV